MAGKRTQEIRRAMREFIQDQLEDDIYATVKSVDEATLTCEVEFDSTTRPGVLLRSTTDADTGFILVPTVGSKVLISTIAETRSYISMYSQVDKVISTIDSAVFSHTADGFKMENGSSGLKKTLEDLCIAIGALTVTTNMGPSGVPINKASFDQIKSDLSNYLE